VKECPEKLAGRVGPALPPEEISRRFPETLLFNDHAVDAAERLADLVMKVAGLDRTGDTIPSEDEKKEQP